MNPSFRIDQAFRLALRDWRAFVDGLATEPTSLRLAGGRERLLPDRLVVGLPELERELAIEWPAELPSTRDQLRGDERVWHLFLSEWSRSEITDYLELPVDVSEDTMRAAFVASGWWAEFEAMIVSAFRYEWRNSLASLAPVNGHRVCCSIETPDLDDAGLDVFEARLQRAARGFEATHFDAQLLYGENARIVGFLVLAADA